MGSVRGSRSPRSRCACWSLDTSRARRVQARRLQPVARATWPGCSRSCAGAPSKDIRSTSDKGRHHETSTDTSRRIHCRDVLATHHNDGPGESRVGRAVESQERQHARQRRLPGESPHRALSHHRRGDHAGRRGNPRGRDLVPGVQKRPETISWPSRMLITRGTALLSTLSRFCSVNAKPLSPQPIGTEFWFIAWAQLPGAAPPTATTRLFAFDGERFRTLWTTDPFVTPYIDQAVEVTQDGRFTLRRMPDFKGMTVINEQYAVTADGPQKVTEWETERR